MNILAVFAPSTSKRLSSELMNGVFGPTQVMHQSCEDDAVWVDGLDANVSWNSSTTEGMFMRVDCSCIPG
jgi:hypothetical protein